MCLFIQIHPETTKTGANLEVCSILSLSDEEIVQAYTINTYLPSFDFDYKGKSSYDFSSLFLFVFITYNNMV
jgi:hypothetical protein